MSEENEADVSCCASCGIAEVDDIKLVPCDDCDLVEYCSDECRAQHKLEHEEVCEKRAAELRDELLFKQPESSHLGDCPICSLPLPLDLTKSGMHSCCCKMICKGCDYANQKREMRMRHRQSCPFCREPVPDTEEEILVQSMKRVAANDPAAMLHEGLEQYKKGYYCKSFDYYRKAAELGDAEAHWRLAHLYDEGLGVEKDVGKEIHHLEEAAIGGHPVARHNLGAIEWSDNRNLERAVKHWIIAATLGFDGSTKLLMGTFKDGDISKEILTATLRAYQTTVNATKSPQRKEAELYYRNPLSK